MTLPRVSATFDWTEADSPAYSIWSSGYLYTETDNGVTMAHGGRATTGDGYPQALKFTYDWDVTPGTFVMKIDGVDRLFSVLSIDVKADAANGTVPHGDLLVEGQLGGVMQWIIDPTAEEKEDGNWHTYTAPTSGDMSLPINRIVWHSPYSDPGTGNGGVLVWNNGIDNLAVTVDLNP